MCKKAVVIGLLAIGALYVCKKTPVGSYISTWWNRNCPSGEMVSRDFQLDRVETLLAKLEENRKSRLQPIAEKQEEVEHLKQQVQADQAKLNARRDRLRELIQAVEAESPSIQFEGATLTLAEAKTRLERENGAVELLRLREEELAAKEKSLQKDLADLDRIATRAQQHKTRLAQLRNQERKLQTRDTATPGSVPADLAEIDRDIQQTLDRAAKGQRVAGHVADLDARTGSQAVSGSPSGPARGHGALKDAVGLPTAQPKVVSGN